MFRADYIHENGLQAIFQTDRPLTYLITDFIMNVFDVSGRLAIPISSVLFTLFYLISIFILTKILTKNTLISGLSSLFAAGSNIVWMTALCYVGNMLGFAFLYLFFAVLIKFYESGAKRYFALLMVVFVCLLFSHFVSSFIAILVLLFFFMYMLITKERGKLVKLGVCIVLCVALCVSFLIGYMENFNILQSLVKNEFVLNSQGVFLQYLNFDWSSDYLWIFMLTIIGAFIVLFEHGVCKKFLTSWVLGVLAILIVISTEASRIFLYLPFSILSGVSVYFVIDCFQKHRRKLFFVLLAFLILVPSTCYLNTQYMNIKYVEEGPFSWDTKYLETEQLRWIKRNYNLDSSVVLTDVPSDYLLLEERGLVDGVHTRILAEIGNTVYFGKLRDLLLEKPDVRGNSTLILGKYSSINVDWVLGNKTILIPTAVYEISEVEKEICCEVTSGIYVVKSLGEVEKQDWLMEFK